MKRNTNRKFVGAMFFAPALILLASFVFIPLVLTMYYSFTDYFMLNPDGKTFIGLTNYSDILSDPTFKITITNTIKFAVFVVPLQLGGAFILALGINSVSKSKVLAGYFKTAFFSPVVMSLVVTSLLWTILLADSGLINQILGIFNIDRQPFLTSSSQAMYAIIVISAWQGMGYQMIILLAGLQNIPTSQYEAAELDNANALMKFFHVTLPGIRPVFILMFLTITIAATKLLVQPMIMTGGGPSQSTYTMVYYIYETGNTFRQVGYASSMAIVFGLFVVIISLIQRKITGDQ